MSSKWPTQSLHGAGVTLLDCVHKTPAEDPAGEYRYVAIPQMTDGHVTLQGARRISASDFEEWTKKAKPQAHDVVLSRRCNPGETAYVAPGEEFALGQNLVLLRADGSSVFPPFLRWLVRSPAWWEQIRKNLNVGAVFDSLKCRDVPLFRLPLPPLAEQRAIASVLGALDDKIEHNRRTARASEKLARAIFHAWFVDFEPVKAKAAGATSFPSMPQPVFDALPATLADSAIGPVPEGWAVGAINDLATLSKAQVKPQEYPEENFDHFSIPAFDAGMHAVAEPGSAIKSNKFLVIDGCVLLSKLNPRITRVWLSPPACGRRQISSTEFLVFVPSERSDRHYLYCQFQQREFRDELAQEASGTSNSHQRVRPKEVLSHPVVMPVPSIRKAFANIADPLFALQLANHNESVKLAEMRDYLLPKLLSGEIRVGEAEAQVAKAV